MPKVTLGTVDLDQNFRIALKHAVVEIPRQKLCKIIGLSESCYYKRLHKPESVTVRELRALRKTGKINDEQILSFIREEDKHK